MTTTVDYEMQKNFPHIYKETFFSATQMVQIDGKIEWFVKFEHMEAPKSLERNIEIYWFNLTKLTNV